MFSAASKTDGSTTANYIEDVFSTYIYTGNGVSQNINNGINIGTNYPDGFSQLHLTGETLTDTSPFARTITANAVVVSTAQKKFGTSSLYFDGNTYLTAGATFLNDELPSWELQCWVYWNSTGTSTDMGMIASQYTSASSGRALFGSQSGNLVYRVDGGTVYLTGAVTTGTWYHIVLNWDGTTHRLFIGGVLVDSTTTAPAIQTTVNTEIGGNSDLPAYDLDGYIDDLTITNSQPVYTANFTPPTSPSPIDTVGAAGKGGMVWIKGRSGATDHALYDTVRGATLDVASNLTTGQTTQVTGLNLFYGNGFSIGALAKINTNNALYASWTFREQAKFFDVVTYTGNGANRTIAHNLGSVPGCIIIKRTDTTAAWAVYHRSLANTQYLVLNTTAGAATGATYWNSTTPTSTEFSLGTSTDVNANTGTYVAYLFAHDAGGFGLTGSDNVISCGTFTGASTVTLGYEPQWIMIKRTDVADNWRIIDNIRGWSVAQFSSLRPNTTGVETSDTNTAGSAEFKPTATGFYTDYFGGTWIYIAIRRGPMKTPTTGTSVFQPVVYTGTNVDNRLVTTSILTDFIMARQRSSTTASGMLIGDRLRGDQYWFTDGTGFGVTDPDSLMTPTVGYGYSFSAMNGFGCGNDGSAQLNLSTVASNQVVEAFARAPGFLDVVAYTGTGANRTVSHNLGVKPEMMMFKGLSISSAGTVYTSAGLASNYLQTTDNGELTSSATYFNNTEPTSTQFTVGTVNATNANGQSYVAYLMASVPGVSKCSYYVGRGVGTSHQVDCGFAAGARFILIKSLGVSGSWFVYDSARGIVSGNDPYILLDTTAAEVTSTDYIDPYSLGFEVTTTAPIGLNQGYAQDWTSQLAVAGTTNMNDVLYANGLWLVGSSNGNVYRSTTGYSWTAATGVVTGGVNGLAYGNNLYVAVGAGGSISTSPDAVTWTAKTSGVSNPLNGAAYAFGKYWVCGDTGTLLSSSDGTTWSTVSLGTTADLYRVRFLNGQLIIVGQTGTLITSTDGTTFTTRTTGVSIILRDVSFGASIYVVVGHSGTIITSTNLSAWTTRSAGTLSGNTIYGVTYAGYRFVAVASAGENAYSADGITWTTGAGAGADAFYCVAYGNDMVIAGNSTGDLFVSDVRYWYWAIA